MKRLIKIGDFKVGPNNNISDVNGVLVGHSTISNENNHTGVTVVLPHSGNLFKEKVVAGSFVYNGFGKSVGLIQVEELGTIETPIVLTNTLSVCNMTDSLITYMLKDNPEIGKTTSTINSLVLECNDGSINDIQNRVLKDENLFDAITSANADFLEGSVGAGSGMKCHGFKGGIGSSSRIVKIQDKEYTIGVLVNSNFGSSNGSDLIIKGRHMGELIKNYDLEQTEDKGSIIVVIATDAPLDSRQLTRLCKRAELGIARTGSYAGNGSGDIMVGFSTTNKVVHYPNGCVDMIERFSDNYINKLFKATVDATEEAVLNSMFHSIGMKSYNGTYYKSINEYKKLFEDLLEKEC
jgi:D-aminopeptidase